LPTGKAFPGTPAKNMSTHIAKLTINVTIKARLAVRNTI
jgi:hypothetical protein